MNSRTRQLVVPAFLLAGASAGQAAALPACPIQSGQTATYDILRGGDVIGSQSVHYTMAGADMTVDITVTAAIRVLGVRVYNYTHRGTEHWHDGQMVSLVTKTDDDGIPRQVNATRDPATGWRGLTGASPGMAPLLATSLWNSQTTEATRLLDRETGGIQAVRVTAVGDEVLRLGTRSVPAHRFDLTGVVSGSTWYDASGCWVRALFHTRVDGSLVEVRAR